MSEPSDSLAEMLRDALQLCIDNGLEMPFTLAVIAGNASALVMRTDGESAEMLAEHIEGGKFRIPIHVLVTDQNGEAARILIGPGGRPRLMN